MKLPVLGKGGLCNARRKSNHLKMIDEQGKLRLGIRACSSNSGADSSLTFPHYIVNLDPQHFIAVGRTTLELFYFYKTTQRVSKHSDLLTTLCVL